jgi:hypothetical protein
MLVEVIGRPLKYGKQRQAHAVGSKLEMSDAHARVFIAIRKVRPVGLDEPPAFEDAPLTERSFDLPSLDDLPKPKRKYKRRDMQAE